MFSKCEIGIADLLPNLKLQMGSANLHLYPQIVGYLYIKERLYLV
jgi:hypothetical protein